MSSTPAEAEFPLACHAYDILAQTWKLGQSKTVSLSGREEGEIPAFAVCPKVAPKRISDVSSALNNVTHAST